MDPSPSFFAQVQPERAARRGIEMPGDDFAHPCVNFSRCDWMTAGAGGVVDDDCDICMAQEYSIAIMFADLE